MGLFVEFLFLSLVCFVFVLVFMDGRRFIRGLLMVLFCFCFLDELGLKSLNRFRGRI